MLKLELIRGQLRMDPDATDEDAQLELYGRAAWRMVEGHTGRKLYASPDDVPAGAADAALVVDADLELAMLLLIGHWYTNREAVLVGTSAQTLPLAFDALVGPYRWYSL